MSVRRPYRSGILNWLAEQLAEEEWRSWFPGHYDDPGEAEYESWCKR